MDYPLVSVIVPIYKIERYLGTCIESIICQTYQNLEIILVDDGGKDRCPEICDLYSSKDRRISVIHKPNGGLVSARKAGLQQSSGKYISYVDGDDWISPGFIEALLTTAGSSGADVVCAGFTRDLFSKSENLINAFPTGIYEGESLRDLWKSMISCGDYYRPGISTYVWNKLFKREILMRQQIRVDSRISIGEDGAVTYPVLLQCKRVAVIDNVAYHYRQREDSMLKQSIGYVAEARKLFYLYDYMMEWAKKTDPELKLKNQVLDYVLSIAIIRFGGRLPQNDFLMFGKDCYRKKVVIYSAGTFGQQLVSRFKEAGHCEIIAWLDDDYWEYRRGCLNVDPVETITDLSYDYILIATVDRAAANLAINRLLDLGIGREKILTIAIPENKEYLIKSFFDADALHLVEEKEEKGINSHA